MSSAHKNTKNCKPVATLATYVVRVLLLAATAIIFTGCEQSTEDHSRSVAIHAKQVAAYQQSGQYRAAMIEAKNIIQKQPGSNQGHTLLAGVLVELGQYRNALDALDKAPEPGNDKQLATTRIKAYLGRGKFTSALNTLNDNPELDIESPIEYSLLRAAALAGLNDDKTASRAYRRVLGTEPNNERALAGLARLALKKNDNEQLQALLNRIESAHPDSIDARLLKANMSIAGQDYNTAENLLSEALIQLPDTDIITPPKATILSTLAAVLVKQGRSSEALIYTRILADAFPGYETAQELYRTAIEKFRQDDIAAAEQDLIALLEEYPNFENAALTLAVIKYQQGDYDAASNYFNANVDPELTHPDITALTALSNLHSNQPRQVMAMLEGHPNLQNDARLLTMYGRSALAENEATKAIDALQRAIELDATSTSAYLALANHYESQNPRNDAEALRYLKQAYRHDQTEIGLVANLARQLVINNEINAAEQLINDQLSLRNNDVTSLLLAGDLYYTQRLFDKARDFYSSALNTDSNNYLAAIKLAYISHQSNDTYQTIVDAFTRAIKIDPSQPRAYEGIILAAVDDNEITRGEKLITELAKQTRSGTGYAVLTAHFSHNRKIEKARYYASLLDNSVEPKLSTRALLILHFAQATESYQKEQHDAAKEHIFAGLKISPQSLRFLSLLIEIEIANENYSEANKLIAQVDSINEVVAQQLTGHLLESQADIQGAIQAYNTAWQSNPNSLVGRRLYSLLSQQDRNNANRFIDSWIAAQPGNTVPLLLKSNSLLIDGNFDNAIPILEEIQSAAPDNAANLNNLAWAYLQTGSAKAQATAARAAELAPSDGSVLDTYGWILYQNGDIQRAVTILERAAELTPDNSDINEHLRQARSSL